MLQRQLDRPPKVEKSAPALKGGPGAGWISALGSGYLRFVAATSRTVWLGRDRVRLLEASGRNFVYAFWHARQAALAHPHRDEPICVLVSRSRDGSIIADALARLGIRTVRGSSTRGGSTALKELLREAEAGRHPGITPDGPRGPALRVKPGALFLAQRLGCPIVPIAAASTRKKVFSKSWDGFQLPWPFNRVVIAHGEPFELPEDASPSALARELERRLNRTAAEADREAAAPGAGLFLLFYRLFFPLLGAGLLVKLLFSSRRGVLKSIPAELNERLGRYPLPPRGRSVLWCHAASVGEVKSLAKVLDRLRAGVTRPYLVVTTSTRAGRAEARKLAGVDAAYLAPVDVKRFVERALRRLQPTAYFAAETEIWPNTLLAAARHGARLFVLNGRISARSAARYRWIGPLIRECLAPIDRLCVQTRGDAERYAALGASPDRIVVVGNLKHDLPAKALPPESFRGLAWTDCAAFVAGSTRKGEEEQLVAAYKALKLRHPSLRLVLAPRHVERAEKVLAILEAEGLRSARFSALKGPAEGIDCLLMDRMGHLLSLYAGAAVTFVGGTLVPKGGHNLLEPASLGKPVLFGPHTETVRDVAETLVETGGGYQARSSEDLAAKLDEWLADPAALRQAGERARLACRKFQGATQLTLDTLLPRLKG